MNKPYILITNDDGINSPGIDILYNSLFEFADVVIVAPDSQKSAVSSMLTINKPLRVNRFYKNNSFFGFSVDGTPADCVKLALSTLLEKKPDLVVSGINHGKNTSINVLYSGTVAGATEGYLAGINSIAISHCSHSLSSDLSYTSYLISKLARNLLNYNGIDRILLNVNVPDLEFHQVKGVKITKLSNSRWEDKYEKRADPFGNTYYWFAGSYIISSNETDTDDGAVENDYVSVTPIHPVLYDDSLHDLENILDFENGQNDINRGLERRNGSG